MKRDMDFIRNILLDMESLQEPSTGKYFLSGADELAFDYNMRLMIDKGLIEARIWETYQERSYAMARLTWEGADFLDSVRNPEVWRKTKEGVKAAGGFSFDLLKALAKGLVKRKIESHTGVELDL